MSDMNIPFRGEKFDSTQDCSERNYCASRGVPL